MNNPEEVNWITTDHLSALGFCATQNSYDNMRREGVEERAFLTGNIMYDSFLRFAKKPWNPVGIVDFEGRAARIVTERQFKNTILTQPVGYSDSVHLTLNARKIVTDSGGLQCEAFYAGVQCVTVFDFASWPETMVANRNQLAKANREDILRKLSAKQTVDPSYQPFGDGHAAEKICERIRLWESSI